MGDRVVSWNHFSPMMGVSGYRKFKVKGRNFGDQKDFSGWHQKHSATGDGVSNHCS